MDYTVKIAKSLPKKIIAQSKATITSPVTYLASYVIPQEKRTAEELETLNEILKLGGGGATVTTTTTTRSSNNNNDSNNSDNPPPVMNVLLPSALLWSGNVLHQQQHGGGENATNNKQLGERRWTVLDQRGQHAKNLKASKTHVAAAFGIPLRDLHYLDPFRPTMTPANIFIRQKALIVNLEHLKFIVTAETALFLNAESLEVKRFIKFLRKYLKEVESTQRQKQEDLVSAASAAATAAAAVSGGNGGGGDEQTTTTTTTTTTSGALKNAGTATTIQEERVLHLPFELLVLECAMHELGIKLDNETIALEREAAPCMEKMLQSVQAEELAEGRRIKEKLNALILRLEAFTEALSSILEHDESLDAMCLSKLKVMELVRGDDDENDDKNESATAQTGSMKKVLAKTPSSKKAQFITRVISNPPTTDASTKEKEEQEYDPENEDFETIESTYEEDGHEHEGAEALLEAYYMHAAATQKRAHMLKDLLQSTEAVSSMILDRQRNELIKIDLVVSAALFACSIMSVAGSIFGMNLQSNLETKSGFFVGVILVTSALAAASFVFIIFYCSRKKLFQL